MKILHLDGGREMRGGQWQALYLAQGLAARGHFVKLLAPADSPLLDQARRRRLDTMPLGYALTRKLSEGADLVHAHDARAHTVALGARAPVVVSRRVAFPVKEGLLSRWKYSRPSRYIAISAHVRRSLLDAGIEADKITVVHDGVPLRPAVRGGARIVAPATADPQKGSALLREAAALGAFEVCFSRDLARDLESASAFVYITHDEGLGSGVLLAMAAGVPVVASNVGGIPEIIENGETGILTANTAPAIAEAVERIRRGREDALAMADRARKRVEEDFSIDRMVEKTLDVYRAVV